LVLPAECEVDGATASFENGIIRITIPRPRQRVTETIKVQVGKSGEPSRSTKDKPDVIEAVKGRGYREVALKSGRRKGRQK
jgi:hypothetical protein